MTDGLVIPLHLGIILDGNGRWAKARGLPRSAGHKVGIEKIRAITDDCLSLGIRVLTLYVFSTENWSRPRAEVDYLMDLAEEYANRELPVLVEKGVRLRHMGRREGLPDRVLLAMDRAVEATRENTNLHLNLAINYGGREELVQAVSRVIASGQGQSGLDGGMDELAVGRYLYCSDLPDVDLVIRTSGEMRLSNFLTWRAANALFISSPIYWPDFNRQHLLEALEKYTGFIRSEKAAQSSPFQTALEEY